MTKKFLITGASGFVGSALANRLLSEGNRVVCVSRREVKDLISKGAEFNKVDISSPPENFAKLFKDVDTVFHTAAKVAMWGKYEDFYQTNVIGTLNILKAAKQAGVRKFVYTSSPSVIADGSDLRGVDESYPYPKNFKAFYPKTKSEAEKEVLTSNNKDFWTVALRPHLIFGSGDTSLTKTVINQAKNGKLMKIGEGTNLVDFTFITDCVTAHINAASALETNPNARGRAFFISQGDPVLLWDWINKVLELNGVPPLKKSISKNKALILAGVSEFFGKLLGLKELALTKFLVSEMTTDHYFSIEAAKKELGFYPKYKVMEALEETFKGTQASLPVDSPTQKCKNIN